MRVDAEIGRRPLPNQAVVGNGGDGRLDDDRQHLESGRGGEARRVEVLPDRARRRHRAAIRDIATTEAQMRPRTDTTPAGGGTAGISDRDARCAIQPRSTRTTRPSASTSGVTTVVSCAPRVDLVVDQDLPGRHELAGRDHGQIAQCRPIGIVGERCERNRFRARGVIELRAQRLLGVEPLALPVPGRDAHDDRRNRRERGQQARPAKLEGWSVSREDHRHRRAHRRRREPVLGALLPLSRSRQRRAGW